MDGSGAHEVLSCVYLCSALANYCLCASEYDFVATVARFESDLT